MKRLLCLMSTLLFIVFCGCSESENSGTAFTSPDVFTENSVPEFDGTPYVALNGNKPQFSEEELTAEPFEEYSPLDGLGRCGVAYACISKELMPTEERGSIGQIKPSGWHTVKYDNVDGKYLYNRCHLIGFQLTGENANERNLITGTRFMNVDGMLPFENMVADYIKETDNRVLYRVTPIFDGENLVARGVKIEAQSIEDGGDGICFNVYVYNSQPGITVNYSDGTSTQGNTSSDSQTAFEEKEIKYILNTKSKKIHKSDCSGAKSIKEENREEYYGDIAELQKEGYTFCGTCFK